MGVQTDVFILPNDRIPVDNRAIIYHNLNKSLPAIVGQSVANGLNVFLSYFENNAILPSAYLEEPLGTVPTLRIAHNCRQHKFLTFAICEHFCQLSFVNNNTMGTVPS